MVRYKECFTSISYHNWYSQFGNIVKKLKLFSSWRWKYACRLPHGQINFPSTIRFLLSNVQWKFLKDKTIIDDAKQCKSPKNEVNKLLISMTHQVFQLECANNANPLIFLFFTCKAILKFWCITLYIYIREFAYERQVFWPWMRSFDVSAMQIKPSQIG